jgi:hypothetical protein
VKRSLVKITATLNQPTERKLTPEAVFSKIFPSSSYASPRGLACSESYASWAAACLSLNMMTEKDDLAISSFLTFHLQAAKRIKKLYINILFIVETPILRI